MVLPNFKLVLIRDGLHLFTVIKPLTEVNKLGFDSCAN